VEPDKKNEREIVKKNGIEGNELFCLRTSKYKTEYRTSEGFQISVEA